MTAPRDDLSKLMLRQGRFESSDPPEVAAGYFDSAVQAWVLSRHADVLAAFHSPSLIPGRRDLAKMSLESDEDARLRMREEVRGALSPARTRAWRERLGADADEFSRRLPVCEPVDLVAAYGQPLCLRFAATVTGINESDADRLAGLAKIVSAATADPENYALQAEADRANETLRTYFSEGPEPLRDSGFVGLSQTLSGIVSAAWHALVQFPDQWRELRGSPQFIDQAMEELLRYDGVLRTLTRTATEDTDVNGVSIRKGEWVLLRVFEANHDPARFVEPNKLDCARRDLRHFVFGTGGHACVAANLIRMAAVTMTLPLLARFTSAELVHPVEWQGGSTMRSPVSLWVALGCSESL